MFYPVDSLKKGGRFYLCWIADSWPLRFEKFTYRNQRLWSQDIREICDHLREVMISESGRPSHRFSLRLSSQLMRGLTRLYQKKVVIFIRDVLHITAKVRSARTSSEHAAVVRRRPTNRDRPRLVIEELPEEVNVEQIQENAQNTVARVEDITLREPTLPEIRLIEDGFGELNQDPIEIMLAHEISAMQQSVLDLPLDFSADKSNDKSRLAPHDTAQMERISERDISVFRKSAVEAPSLADLEKEIPEIPEIPPPDLPAPEPQMQVVEQPLEEAQIEQPAREPAKQNEPQHIVLEDLEDEPQRKKRRSRNKLIVDKVTQLSNNYIRARIADERVELRCESTAQDIIVIRTPASTLLTRPAHGGRTPTRALGRALGALFAESVANRTPAGDRPVEEVLFQRPAQNQVEEIIQAETSVGKTIHDKTIQELTIQEQDVQDQVMQDISNRDISACNVQNTEAVAMDIADLPTQKLITISQEKRHSGNEQTVKRRSQRNSNLNLSAEANKENIPGAENVPVQEYVPEIPRIVLPPNEATQLSNTEHLTSMLQEAGLVDAQPRPASMGIEPATLTQRERRTHGSEGSETPLGSLDRTKVSLGESEKTTDSKRFIDEQWGVQGTMHKIYQCFLEGVPQITVESLVHRGPVIESSRRIIAARCFTSILSVRKFRVLKQYCLLLNTITEIRLRINASSCLQCSCAVAGISRNFRHRLNAVYIYPYSMGFHLLHTANAIHGEVNILHDLVLAFVECGRLRQARRILETPGLQTRHKRLTDACLRYVEEGKSEHLEGLLEATKELSHIDRSNIFYHLLVSYCKADETDKALGLWTILQEEGEVPSDQFLIHLGEHLKSKNIKVPFIIPEQEKTPKAQPTQTKKSESEQPKSVKKDVTAQIENLTQGGKTSQALDCALKSIEDGVFPKANVLKFLLKNLAEQGEVEKIQALGKHLNETMRRNVTYDDKLTLAIFTQGNGAQHVDQVLNAVESATSEEDIQVALRMFPRSNALARAVQDQDLGSKCHKVAELAASKGQNLPANLLWMEYLLAGKNNEADSLWKMCLQDSEVVVFRRLLQESHTRREPQRIQQLIDILKTNEKISPASIGNAYSRLINLYLVDNKIDEAKEVLDRAFESGIASENLNKSSIKRLKDAFDANGKKFEYTV